MSTLVIDRHPLWVGVWCDLCGWVWEGWDQEMAERLVPEHQAEHGRQ
jgi:hypothetical protein